MSTRESSSQPALPDPLTPEGATALRQEAEDIYRQQAQPQDGGPGGKAWDQERLIEELYIHQIELELQNQSLCATRLQLEESLNRYAALYNFAPIALLTLSGDGTIREANQTAADLLGLPLTGLLDRRLGIFVSEATRPAFNDLLTGALRGEAVCRRELVLSPPGQPPRWVQAEGISDIDRVDRTLQVHLALTDVSERTRDQAALKESHTRLDLSLEVARLSTFVFQPSSGTINLDDRLFAALGIPPAERGHSLSFDEYLNRYVHPDDRAGFAARVGQLLAEGTELQHEYRLVRRDNAVIDVQSRVRVFPDAAGQPLQVLGVIQDVTQRKQRERLAQQLAAIVHSSADAIIGENPDGIVTSWNRAAEHIFGFTAGEMLGQPLARLVPPALAGEEAQILARIRAGEPVPYFETQRVCQDGHTIDVGVTLSPVRDDKGTIVGASKIARDISERKQMERTNAVLREMLDRSPDFVGFTGASLRILYINRGGRRLVGMADEVDARQLSIAQFHPPAVFQQIANLIIPDFMARTGFCRVKLPCWPAMGVTSPWSSRFSGWKVRGANRACSAPSSAT